MDTDSLLNEETEGTERTEKMVQKANKALSAERKDEIDKATQPSIDGVMDWSNDPDKQTRSGKKKTGKPV